MVAERETPEEPVVEEPAQVKPLTLTAAVSGNQIDISSGEGGSGVQFVTMNVNRPFFYIIRHITTGAVLMAGSVSNIAE